MLYVGMVTQYDGERLSTPWILADPDVFTEGFDHDDSVICVKTSKKRMNRAIRDIICREGLDHIFVWSPGQGLRERDINKVNEITTVPIQIPNPSVMDCTVFYSEKKNG